jgi:ABC-type dipeptide/oligopeptide/nickel transport system ATPase component
MAVIPFGLSGKIISFIDSQISYVKDWCQEEEKTANQYKEEARQRESETLRIRPSEPYYNATSPAHIPIVNMGGIALPDVDTDSFASNNVVIIGSPGSGKTILNDMAMHSALSRIKEEPDSRAIIFDEKQEVLHKLLNMGFTVETGDGSGDIWITNPYDERSLSWSLGEDFDTSNYVQLAHNLIPDNPSDSYWAEAPRKLLSAVIKNLILLARNEDKTSAWTLADLVYICQDKKILRYILQLKEGWLEQVNSTDIIENFASERSSAQDVLSAIDAFTGMFESTSALWQESARRRQTFSINKFMQSKGKILVLGNFPEASSQTMAINRLIFQRVSQLSLQSSPIGANENRRIWYFMDEFQRVGQLAPESVMNLMTNGRTYGVRCFLSFQSISGLTSIYKDKAIVDAILGCAQNKIILQLAEGETALWAEKEFGSHLVYEASFSNSAAHTFSQKDSSMAFTKGTNIQIQERKLYLMSEFLSFPKAGIENGIKGVYKFPVLTKQGSVSPFMHHIPGWYLQKFFAMTRGAYNSLHDFFPYPKYNKETNPVDYYILSKWVEDDYLRLGIPSPLTKGEIGTAPTTEAIPPADSTRPQKGIGGRGRMNTNGKP